MKTVMMASVKSTGLLARAATRISSLLQNPASGQMPARLSEPMTKVA